MSETVNLTRDALNVLLRAATHHRGVLPMVVLETRDMDAVIDELQRIAPPGLFDLRQEVNEWIFQSVPPPLLGDLPFLGVET